jgi:hypothetical protein
MIRAFNFVISLYCLVSSEEVRHSAALNTAQNTVLLKLRYLQSRLKLLGGVCKSGVQTLVAYFV